MTQDLSVIIPKILAQGLLALREYCIMPQIVNTDYSAEAREKGGTIDVPISSAVTVQDVAPANVAPNLGDTTLTKAQIPLNYWREAGFYLTDKNLLEVMNDVMPMQASEAIRAIANDVNAKLFGQYKNVFGYVGTAGTTPFGNFTTPKLDDAINVRKVLTEQLCPPGPRYMVLGPDAEAAALAVTGMQDASFRGDTEGIREGQIGRKMGFDWYADQSIPSHTAGTITTGLISKAATVVAVGATSLLATTAASTGAAALLIGDLITFVGDAQTYVLTANATQASAASDVTLSFQPPLKVAHTGSEAVSVKATHVVNLAFHRDCFALAVRPLLDTNLVGEPAYTAVDPVSKLALRLEVKRENKRTRWSYDILYGVGTPRPEFGCVLAG